MHVALSGPDRGQLAIIQLWFESPHSAIFLSKPTPDSQMGSDAVGRTGAGKNNSFGLWSLPSLGIRRQQYEA